ncbi:hypothetical protein BHE74_00006625 [Ensete ventricosum]|nr:hypothetical protein BHE74_00006625 [Ensete ventricosum]
MAEPDSNITNGNAGQFFNPAFVHSIAVPEVDMLPGLNKVCAAARGDGVIDVIDLEVELANMKSKSSSIAKRSQPRSRKSDAQSANTMGQVLRKRTQLDYSLGGHTAGVSCVKHVVRETCSCTTALLISANTAVVNGGSSFNVWLREEKVCLAMVSCAGILALAARDGVVLLGGPSWSVPLGRRDATKDAAVRHLPAPDSSLPELISAFSAKCLSARDLTAFSANFRYHVYNDTNIAAPRPVTTTASLRSTSSPRPHSTTPTTGTFLP